MESQLDNKESLSAFIFRRVLSNLLITLMVIVPAFASGFPWIWVSSITIAFGATMIGLWTRNTDSLAYVHEQWIRFVVSGLIAVNTWLAAIVVGFGASQVDSRVLFTAGLIGLILSFAIYFGVAKQRLLSIRSAPDQPSARDDRSRQATRTAYYKLLIPLAVAVGALLSRAELVRDDILSVVVLIGACILTQNPAKYLARLMPISTK